jgi:tetratricopeptide (TPR) repeat protein
MPSDLPVGTRLGSYEIESLVGAGGMGEVYRARDVRLRRAVAIKLLLDRADRTSDSVERFYREARAVSALNHPNICTVYDIGEFEGQPFLVMEYLEGATLLNRLRAGPLTVEEIVQVGAQIADALDTAHSHRIIHRDIKPANIFVTSRQQAKVLDFGIAKLLEPDFTQEADATTASSAGLVTAPGVAVGTVAYMSPEQARGERLDARSDLFSLGVVIYEMATRHLPFQGATAPVIFDAILNRAPVPVRSLRPDLPSELESTIHHALEKDRAARIQNAAEFRARLRGIRLGAEGQAAPQPAAPPEPGGRRHTVFVGRELEQAEIRQFIDRALLGRGGLVLINGEPGIGKTRLTEEAAVEARARGLLVLTGHCYDMQATTPYLPLVEVLETMVRFLQPETLLATLGDAAPEAAKLMPELRRLFPGIVRPIELPPEREQRYMLNCFRDFFERAARLQPLLLVLEDLHWADEGSLLLLERIAQRVAEMPALLLATYRDDDLATSPLLARTLRDLRRGRLAHDLPLRRLPAAAVGAILRAHGPGDPPARLLEVVYAETEGNPFFVEEVFRHLVEEGRLLDAKGGWHGDVTISESDVPRSVRLVLEQRLGRISASCRRAVAIAAVIGRNFEYQLLAAVSDMPDEAILNAIEEAERSQLIEDVSVIGDARYTFSHELIRQTLLSTLALPRRQRIHRRIAEAMEQRYGERVAEHAGELAHHLQQAGAAADAATAVRYLVLAGDRALGATAFEEALRLFDAALDRLPGSDARGRADLHRLRGHALRSLGRLPQVFTEWARALALYETSGGVRESGRTSAELAHEYANAGRLDDAIAVTRAGIERLGDTICAERCVLLGEASYQFALLGSCEVSAAHITQAITLAGQLGDSRLTGRILANKATFHWAAAQPRDEAEAALAAADIARAHGAHWDLANALTEVVYPLIRMGRFAEAAALSKELDTLATRIGHWFALRIVRYVSALLGLMREGDVASLEAASRNDIELMAANGLPWGYFGHINLGLVRLLRGLTQEAIGHFDDAVANEPPLNGFTGSWAFTMLGRAYAGAGSEALQLFSQRRDELPKPGRLQTYGMRMMLAAVAEAVAVLDEREAAAALVPLLSEALETGDVLTLPWGHRLLNTVAGMAAATAGAWPEAEAHYTMAISEAEALPHRIEQPEVRHWYARMLLDRAARGDRDNARRLLEEAIGMYGALNMTAHVQRAEALLTRVPGSGGTAS